MSNEQNQTDAEFQENLEQARQIFQVPLQAEDLESVIPGFSAAGFNLVDRQVENDVRTCPAGHTHRMIALVETFKRAAENPNPSISLEEGFSQIQKFAEEAGADTGDRGLEAGIGYDNETHTVSRVVEYSDTSFPEGMDEDDMPVIAILVIEPKMS